MSLFDMLAQTEPGQMLITFLIAMLPVVELRGAIPVGVSMGLGHIQAMIVSMLGNMVPVPLIILFIRSIFLWLRNKSERLERFVSSLEKRAEGKWERVHNYQLFGLVVLVAIPLPGTGAWTGALVAALMDIRMKHSVPAIMLGVLIAGVLVTGITYGFGNIFG